MGLMTPTPVFRLLQEGCDAVCIRYIRWLIINILPWIHLVKNWAEAPVSAKEYMH